MVEVRKPFYKKVSILSHIFMEKRRPLNVAVLELISNILPEFGISDCRFSCYARFPIGAYYICPPNNMDGKMQEL